MNIDNQIIEFIVDNRIEFLNPVFVLISHLGDLMIIWIVLTLVLLITNKKLKLLKVFLAAYLANFLLVELILKHLISRPRPFIDNNVIEILIHYTPVSSSMPSGHASSSFVAATMLAYYFPKYRVLFFILAGLIAFSRVYVGVHYLSDIIFGAAVGILVALVTIYITKKITRS